MKTLMVLMLPVLIAAQDMYFPDTVFTISGRAYPCTIEQFTSKSVRADFTGDKVEPILLNIVDRIILKSKGEVYNSKSAYVAEIDVLNQINASRTIEVPPPVLSADDSEQNMIEPPRQEKVHQVKIFTVKPDKLFSIGFSYNPIQTHWYQVLEGYYGNDIVTVAENVVDFIPEFSFYLSNNVAIFFNLSYFASTSSQDYLYIRDYVEFTDTDDYSFSSKRSVLTPQLGAKYVIGQAEDKKTRFYIALSGGKSFGKVVSEYVNNEEQDDIYPIEIENYEEFNSDLNSPIILNALCGAEYQLNPALSFFVRGTVRHQIVSATLKVEREYEDGRIYTQKDERELTDNLYFGGFGFHFYF